MANDSVTFTGGEKLEAILKKAGKGGVDSVDIGVFASSKYPDGTPVATVAAWNEWGTEDIPERPAIRNANTENEKNIITIIKRTVDPGTMVITEAIAKLIGANQQGAIQQSIVKLRSPANADSTIKAKRSSNPLIGKEELFKKSITFKVNK